MPLTVTQTWVRSDPKFFIPNRPFVLTDPLLVAKYHLFPADFLTNIFSPFGSEFPKPNFPLKNSALGFYYLEALEPDDYTTYNTTHALQAQLFNTYFKLDDLAAAETAFQTIEDRLPPPYFPLYGLNDLYVVGYEGPIYVTGPTSTGPAGAVLFVDTRYPTYVLPTIHDSYNELKTVILGTSSLTSNLLIVFRIGSQIVPHLSQYSAFAPNPDPTLPDWTVYKADHYKTLSVVGIAKIDPKTKVPFKFI